MNNSDLDRYKKLCIDNYLNPQDNTEEEEKIIYEKLSTLIRIGGEQLICPSYRLSPTQYEDLTKNQKTPEDIEKIKKYDYLIKDDIIKGKKLQDLLEIEVTINQLKEENKRVTHLNYELTLRNAQLEEAYRNREQDSKTNAEIVEKIKNKLKFLEDSRSTECEKYKMNRTDVYCDCFYCTHSALLQSILKETK